MVICSLIQLVTFCLEHNLHPFAVREAKAVTTATQHTGHCPHFVLQLQEWRVERSWADYDYDSLTMFGQYFRNEGKFVENSKKFEKISNIWARQWFRHCGLWHVMRTTVNGINCSLFLYDGGSPLLLHLSVQWTYKSHSLWWKQRLTIFQVTMRHALLLIARVGSNTNSLDLNQYQSISNFTHFNTR